MSFYSRQILSLLGMVFALSLWAKGSTPGPGYWEGVDASSPFILFKGEGWTPERELKRSKALFQNPESFIKIFGASPSCVFPYRTKKLGLYREEDICQRLRAWRSSLASDHVTLAFASQFVSNPASIMGHTFLIFRQSGKPSYLDHTLSYAASMPDDVSAYDYIVKGLWGGFPGAYTLAPFYEKLKMYTRMEQRELWEYEINFTSTEKADFIDLLWERSNLVKKPYLFLKANCSTEISLLLQEITKTENKTDWFYTAPVETIWRIPKRFRNRGEFTPSLRQRLMARWKLLDSSKQQKFLNDNPSLKEMDAVELDTEIDRLALKSERQDGFLHKTDLERKEEAMILRSRLKAAPELRVEKPSDPLETHHFIKLDVGHQSVKKESMGLIRFSPALYRMMDRPYGRSYLNEIRFLNLTATFKDHLARLQDFTLFSIQNHPDYERIDPMYSWRISAGSESMIKPSEMNKTYSYLKGALGVTQRVSDFSFWVLANLEERSEGIGQARLWTGPNIGAYWRSHGIAAKIEWDELWDVSGQSHRSIGALSLRHYFPGDRLDLGIEGQYQKWRPDHSDLLKLQTALTFSF